MEHKKMIPADTFTTDAWGNPASGIAFVEHKMRFRGRRESYPLEQYNGSVYHTGDEVFIESVSDAYAIMDGEVVIGYLPPRGVVFVDHYGVERCRCFIAECGEGSASVYLFK